MLGNEVNTRTTDGRWNKLSNAFKIDEWPRDIDAGEIWLSVSNKVWVLLGQNIDTGQKLQRNDPDWWDSWWHVERELTKEDRD